MSKRLYLLCHISQSGILLCLCVFSTIFGKSTIAHMARCHTTGSRVSGSITTICVLFLQVLLGDALDVVPQHLPVTLSASLSQSLSSFTTARHVSFLADCKRMNTTAENGPIYVGRGRTHQTAPPSRL